MADKQVSVRVAVSGKADFQSDMNDMAASGTSSMNNLGKAIDQATNAYNRQKAAFDNLTEAQAKAQSSQANQTSFNQVLGVNPNSGAGSAQASAQAFQTAYAGMEQRAAALRAQIDPLGTAQNKLNMAVASANELAAAGAISEAERVAAVAQATRQFQSAESALKSFAAMEGVGNTQSMALFAALRHMFDATIAGRPAFQSLAMEAGNLSYGLSGSGGVMAAVRATGAAVGSFLISPLGLAAIAAIALGGAAYVGFSRAEESTKEFTDATNFAGKALGLTRDTFDSTAASAANYAGISVNSARTIESAFAKAGAVSQQSLIGLIDLTKEYADKSDQSLTDATTTMVKAFTDPAKSGEQLLAQLGALDDKTAQLIDTYMQAGNITAAQNVLQDKLTSALKSATDQTEWYWKAWNSVTDAISGAADALSHFGQAAPLAQQKAQLEAELALAQRGQGLPSNTGIGQAHFASGLANAPRPITDILADINAVDAALSKMGNDAKQSAADMAAQKLSNIAGPIVRSAIPGVGDLQALQAQQSNVNMLLSNQTALSKTGATLDQVKEAQDAYTHAVSTYLDPATKALDLEKAQTAAAAAITPAQKAAAAEQEKRVELAGQVITAGQANAQIQQAGAKAYAEAQRAIDKHTNSLDANLAAQLAVAQAYLDGSAAGAIAEQSTMKLDEVVARAAVSGGKQVASIRDETAARKNLNDQVAAGQMTTEQATQQMAIQTALAPLIAAQALAEGQAKVILTNIIKALTGARNDDNAAQTRAKALAEVESGNRNIDLLQQELAISNDNDTQRQIEIAVLEEKQKLLSENISLESDEGRTLLAQAGYAAALNAQLELAKESRQELENMFDTIGQQFANFISQGKYDWKDFASVAVSVLQDISNEIIKLAVLDPLKNLIFGTNTPTLSSVGGVLGSLLGNGDDIDSTIAATPGVFGIHHSGGMAGFANTNRVLPSNVLRFAPRFHQGAYLAPDEVPAILKTGERVLNPQETKAYNAKSTGATPPIEIRVVIDGARGNQEIEDAVNRGTQSAIAASAQMLKSYDAQLGRKVAPIVVKVAGDKRWRG